MNDAIDNHSDIAGDFSFAVIYILVDFSFLNDRCFDFMRQFSDQRILFGVHVCMFEQQRIYKSLIPNLFISDNLFSIGLNILFK